MVYLSLGGLGLVGFLDFFMRWQSPFGILFLIAIPFYLLTLTFTIWIHPITCTIFMLTKRRGCFSSSRVAITIASYCLATTFTYLVACKGYIITV
jgi:hypothetical protein